MLQGVKAEVGQLGGFGMAEDAADAAVIVEVIVVDLNHGCSACARSPRRSRSMAPVQIVSEEGRRRADHGGAI